MRSSMAVRVDYRQAEGDLGDGPGEVMGSECGRGDGDGDGGGRTASGASHQQLEMYSSALLGKEHVL